VVRLGWLWRHKGRMLFLLFQIGKDRYALEAAQVIEVLPLVNLKQIPRAPSGVAGIFNYHGTPVPLIDLTELALGRVSSAKMSTRIILTIYLSESCKKQLIGYLAEQVMETIQRPKSDFVDSGVAASESPYLGSVAIENTGIIQRVEIGRLLPQSLREQLFCDLVDSI
jgi:chemotaxis-related protein WspB